MADVACCRHCRFFQAEPNHVRSLYWVQRPNGDYVQYRRLVGECRARPPVTRPYDGEYMTDTTEGIWPVVLAQNWCGHFARGSRPNG